MSSLNQTCGLLGGILNAEITKLLESYHHSGRWYSGLIGAGLQTTLALTVNVLRASPFIVSKGFSVDRIQFEVTTLGVGAHCIVGIYENTSDNNLYPSTKLVAGSSQDCSSIGLKVDTISISLESNKLYWFVYNCDIAITIRSIGIASVPSVLGGSGIANSNTISTFWNVAYLFSGALPAIFPAGGTIPAQSNVPFIQVRAL